MKFERRLVKYCNDAGTEMRPKGILVYASGSPKLHTREKYISTMNDQPHGSVHALVDAYGVTLTLPPYVRGDHSGTLQGDANYLGVAVMEPLRDLSISPDQLNGLRQRTKSNLVKALTFLCRYGRIDTNSDGFIQLVGTANEDLVSREVSKHKAWSESFFSGTETKGKKRGKSAASTDACRCLQDACTEGVRKDIVDIVELYEQTNRDTSEHAVDEIGVGDVVLHVGSEVYISRGAVTVKTSRASMSFGIVTNVSPRSKHAYEVVFPNGEAGWVNKSTLVKSTLGHIS